jgi:hypothetical protein
MTATQGGLEEWRPNGTPTIGKINTIHSIYFITDAIDISLRGFWEKAFPDLLWWLDDETSRTYFVSSEKALVIKL